MAIAPGNRFDRYEIISPLGAGGMGQVFLARDTRLERKVALKFLPAEFTKDLYRLHRFEQEAKTASALNHPNIITIHEIGETEGQLFIATEFIEGKTLRQQMTNQRLSIKVALDIAIQVASALAAAHETGIIHRDIKPENVMIRRDGYVKVLDFGLAKLAEKQVSQPDSEAQTLARITTDPGMVIGTANYMSPEQARGLKVDERTDVFSLGVVLYEMIAGKSPFTGPTVMDVIAAILGRDPAPVRQYAPNAPPELQRIVSKAIKKDRDERYQGVKDLLLDLKSLRHELEIKTHLRRATDPGLENLKTNEINVDVEAPTSPVSASGSGEIRTTSSAEYLINEIKNHRRGVALTFAALALIISSIFYFKGNDGRIDSIAVLPFSSMSSDANAQFMSDAITGKIINSLSKLPELNVKSQNSVSRYKGNEANLAQIKSELDVQAVLTGQVKNNGENISISVELIDVNDNRHLWGKSYEGKISDASLLEQEVAKDVSNELHHKLSGEEQKYLEAYQLSVKGRNAWNKRTAESMKESIKYFEQARQTAPNYAPAYAGLADCYNMLMAYGALPLKESLPKAKEAAEKALELDETLAEAHAARAYIYFQWEWNWVEAEREFRRAIQLKPNYATAHQWFSSYLAVTGRMDEAVSSVKRAQELEPLSLIVTTHSSWINYLARQYDQAIAHSQQMLKYDPNFFSTHRYMGLAYEGKGKYAEAISELQKAVALSHGSPLLKAELGHALAASGNRAEARKALAELQEMSERQHISSYYFGLIYTGLGEKDRAMEALNKSFEEHAERLVYLSVDPRFDKLRKDARFIDLLQRIGLAL